jgi:hypothetical protein
VALPRREQALSVAAVLKDNHIGCFRFGSLVPSREDRVDFRTANADIFKLVIGHGSEFFVSTTLTVALRYLVA